MYSTMTKVARAAGGLLGDALRISEPPRDPYPETVAENLDDSMQYRGGVEECILRFRESGPWEGDQGATQKKFLSLNADLAGVYEIDEPIVAFVRAAPGGPCCFRTKPAIIVMEPERDGRYSVVTFLHEFAHALGKGERGACRWSLNLFKRYFPKSFGRLEPRGHCLYRKNA